MGQFSISANIRINFMLNGKRCREVIRDMPVNEKTIAYAKSIRELVVDERVCRILCNRGWGYCCGSRSS